MPRNRRTRRASTSIDERRLRIATHLERVVVDLRAAAIEIEKLPAHREQDLASATLAAVSLQVAKVHNTYSRIKQS